jgi:hypothetical protein
VELFEIIRKDNFHQQKSIRQLARDHGVHRRTVRQAFKAVIPCLTRPGFTINRSSNTLSKLASSCWYISLKIFRFTSERGVLYQAIKLFKGG